MLQYTSFNLESITFMAVNICYEFIVINIRAVNIKHSIQSPHLWWGLSFSWVIMRIQTRSEGFGSWYRQTLRCLHRFLWVCLWPSGGGGKFQFLSIIGIFPIFSERWRVLFHTFSILEYEGSLWWRIGLQFLFRRSIVNHDYCKL